MSELTFTTVKANKHVPNLSQLSLKIGDDIASTILKVCKNTDAPMYAFLTTVIKVLLYKCTGRSPVSMLMFPPAKGNGQYFVDQDAVSENLVFEELLNRTSSSLKQYNSSPQNSLKNISDSQVNAGDYGRIACAFCAVDHVICTNHDLYDLLVVFTKSDSLALTVYFNPEMYNEHALQEIIQQVEHVCRKVISERFSISLYNIDVVFLAGSLLLRHQNSAANIPDDPNKQLSMTHLHQEVIDIVKDVLDLSGMININDGFFDVGGNSLKSIVFLSRIYETFGLKIPLNYFRKHSTVNDIVNAISVNKEKKSEKIHAVSKQAYYKVLRKQEKLFFIQDKVSVAYNIPYVIRVKGTLDKEKLQNAFLALIGRHEALRTRFALIENELVQVVEEQAGMEIGEVPASGNSIDEVVSRFIRPFNLLSPPLFRVGWVNLSEEKETLILIDIHHIISDGISCMIMLRDLISFYQQEKLVALTHQFKDYSEWYIRRLKSVLFESYQEYWKERLGNREYSLKLPYDYSASDKNHQLAGKRKYFTVSADEYQKIADLSKRCGTTPFCTLLSVYNLLLFKICNQDEILTGVISSGRHYSEFSNVMGMFINMIPFRNTLDKELTFEEFVSQTGDLFMEDFDNSELDMEDLIPNVRIDSVFVLQNYNTRKNEISDLSWELIEPVRNISKFNLVFIGIEHENRYDFELHYNDHLFSGSTITFILDYYKSILLSVLDNPAIRLGDIRLLASKNVENNFTDDNFYYL